MTESELAAYLARRRERLLVECEAHSRMAETLDALRRERGPDAEGDDILQRLADEQRRSADRAARAATPTERVDTTRA